MNVDNNKKFVLAVGILLIIAGLASIFLDIHIGFVNIISAILMLYLGMASLVAYQKNNSKIQLIVTYIYFFGFFMNIFSGVFFSIYDINNINSIDNINNIDNIAE